MTALISRDELRAAIDEGHVTVVDALGGTYYEQQHLPGAIPLVAAEVAERAAAGYTDVRKYKEGIEDWVAAGLPVQSGSV